MCHLGEAINHRQYNTFAIQPWQPIDEIHSNVRPYLRRHVQGLHEARRVQVLSLILLACGARRDELPDQAAIVLDEEFLPESVEGFLAALVPHLMGELQHRRQERRLLRHEDLAAAEDEAVHDTPRHTTFGHHPVPERAQRWILLQFAT